MCESKKKHNSSTNNNDNDQTRRSFISTTAKISLCAAGLATAGGVVSLIYSSVNRQGDILLGHLNLGMDSLLFLPEHNLFIVRNDKGLGAFSARCTHLGCTVKQSGDGLLCPCHGASYDRYGHVLNGPAPRNLPWYAIKITRSGQVIVESREVPIETVTPLIMEPKA